VWEGRRDIPTILDKGLGGILAVPGENSMSVINNHAINGACVSAYKKSSHTTGTFTLVVVVS